MDVESSFPREVICFQQREWKPKSRWMIDIFFFVSTHQHCDYGQANESKWSYRKKKCSCAPFHFRRTFR